jgi:Thioesterase-like superfamily
VPDSFYEPDGDRFLATELTRGPWDPKAQHAGPPAALIGREVERLGDGRIGGANGYPARVGRITFELVRSVPIGPVRVEAEIVRPGRRVEMFEATLTDDAGEALMRARGWRLRADRVSFDPPPPSPTPPGPERGEPREFFSTGHDVGYHSAMEYRFASGSFRELGPATVWLRMGVPLLPEEDPSPLQRVMVAADTGNGVSAALDWSRFLFINIDLTVHLHRLPDGEWVCLDAVTRPEPSGIGMADAQLYDEGGPLGRAVQTLLVAERT